MTSIFWMLDLDLSAPDHTTLSRRGQHLDLTLHRATTGARTHLIVDSTGLSIVGEGEWAAAKHGGRGRRGWKKLHLGVDRSGVIIAQALTEGSFDDATTGITLIEGAGGDLGSMTADAAYDTVGFYNAAGARGAAVVVPPTSTANVSRHGPRSSARDRTILTVKEMGRRRWKKTADYHRQALARFFRNSWSRRVDSNHRPADYEQAATPTGGGALFAHLWRLYTGGCGVGTWPQFRPVSADVGATRDRRDKRSTARRPAGGRIAQRFEASHVRQLGGSDPTLTPMSDRSLSKVIVARARS